MLNQSQFMPGRERRPPQTHVAGASRGTIPHFLREGVPELESDGDENEDPAARRERRQERRFREALRATTITPRIQRV
eukprot:2259448-Pleurochrysis_carterae.AAC.1